MSVIDGLLPDLVVLAGFMRILTPGFVHHYEGRLLNIHPSLLPAYKGLHTHQRAIDAGEIRHGCSVHFVTPELDGGPVIAQAQVPVLPDDTSETLAARVQRMEHPLYVRVVRLFMAGQLTLDRESGIVLLHGRPIRPGEIDMDTLPA
jgi:phosphoribosylglycinamide formyltransferase-1